MEIHDAISTFPAGEPFVEFIQEDGEGVVNQILVLDDGILSENCADRAAEGIVPNLIRAGEERVCQLAFVDGGEYGVVARLEANQRDLLLTDSDNLGTVTGIEWDFCCPMTVDTCALEYLS